MSIDLSTLKRIETSDASGLRQPIEGPVVILVKLHEGHTLPAYTTLRGHIVGPIFTAEIDAHQLPELDVDPAVDSYSISQPLSKV